MIITLFTQEKMFSISLPEKISGQYWISDNDAYGRERRIASVEGIQSRWQLRGSEALVLLSGNNEVESLELQQNETQVINARYRGNGEMVQFFVEPLTKDRKQFRKYVVPRACRLNVGRAEDNHVVFNNRYVSAHHACLVWEKGVWSATDTQSSNGTFVNKQRIATTPLQPGDAVYIMGLKIVVGCGFFAINNPDDSVQISTKAADELRLQPVEEANSFVKNPSEEETFYCSPRFCRCIVPEEIKVDAPPAKQKIDEVPAALLIGPALTMGMTAIVMAITAVNNIVNGSATVAASIPTLVMSFSMLCGTLLWPMLTKKNEKKKVQEAEQQRRSKYREYLDSVRNRIYSLTATQQEIMLENYPDIKECESRVLERKRNLWERNAKQDDFLKLRLGLGELPLAANFRWPEKRFAMDDDYLLNDLSRLADEPKMLHDVPITCSLRDNHVMGVVGTSEKTTAFVRGLTLQLAALHSKDEVKLAFLIDQKHLSDWEFARWFPHSWSEKQDVRFVACNEVEAKVLSAVLERELAERLSKPGLKTTEGDHYVLISVGTELAERTPAFSQILSAPVEMGFCCIVMAREMRDLPKECSVVVDLTSETACVYDRRDITGKRQQFRMESAEGIDMDRVSVALGNIRIDANDEQYSLPTMLTFLEMYNVGKVEHLNALTRWKENNPVNTLEVPVGYGNGGELFSLNLHEKFHGPHGLVAGMTGSGKSEFIITFILSLAVNFHPDEVSFILIDYKGGGLAGAFENPETGMRLPHLAGTITNLDGTAVKRSLISIQSELRRRQAIFNEARRVSGEGTIDIYKYQKMYRNGLVNEPVPHLFIISDEFAELKSQQPEFMEQLISAARIGRSLGVHLILATQKPSGVVDDQIWSNSRFRVCLKVQERADSMDMIKRPDAAELAETGRFYLQVGFNEFFDMGQSAWCGAPYVSADRVEKNRDESVVVIDRLGRVLAEAKPKAGKSGASGVSQIVSVVQYLSDLAADDQVAARRLWLPPIPPVIVLEDLRRKYDWRPELLELEAIVGEYDDPFNQRQDKLTIPFSKDGNVLLYAAAGGGKNTFLNTLLYGLLQDYDAEHLNVYLLDLGEETLRAFEKAPQVGDVLFSSDSEKVANLFKMLLKEAARRKKLFAEDDGDYRAYCSRTGEVVPHILVVIRNYSAFSEQFELLEEQLLQLTREASKYGIYFLITANSANAVRYRLVQNFANVLTLQLNDRSDYVGLLGSTDGVYPSRYKGRGLFKTDRAYEFQTAHFSSRADQGTLREFAEELAARATCFAPPVPILPERVTKETFRGEISAAAFPVGVEKKSLQFSCLDLERSVMTPVVAQDSHELTEVIQGMCEQLVQLPEGNVTVLDGGALLEHTPEPKCQYTNGDFHVSVEALFKEMVQRNNTYKQAKNEGTELPKFTNQYYVITGLQNILDSLNADGKDKLNTLLEKAETAYAIHFILCDSVKAINGFSVGAWYKRQVTGSDGIWVGDGISDQYALKVAKVTNDLYSELPANFGYMVRRGKPVLIKLLTCTLKEGEGRI